MNVITDASWHEGPAVMVEVPERRTFLTVAEARALVGKLCEDIAAVERFELHYEQAHPQAVVHMSAALDRIAP